MMKLSTPKKRRGKYEEKRSYSNHEHFIFTHELQSFWGKTIFHLFGFSSLLTIERKKYYSFSIQTKNQNEMKIPTANTLGWMNKYN